ncbi:alpha/beta hydrolase [Enterococcus rivorum]|uniref:alpha/beta hydrolase n=1 Tax=Enterococcus rivorum TaxID=762845 RepID=UPI003632C079
MDSFWIRLTGHGENKESFSKATYQDWLNDVESKIKKLQKDYENITCIGFSMGGLLTIQLSEHYLIDQVVLCNTPIYLYNISVITSDLVQAIFAKHQEKRAYYFGSVRETSFKACFQFLTLLFSTKKKLKIGIKDDLKDNILILQNKRDETTYYKSATYIAKLCDFRVSLNLYNGGTHQLFLSENKENAAKDILKFITA